MTVPTLPVFLLSSDPAKSQSYRHQARPKWSYRIQKDLLTHSLLSPIITFVRLRLLSVIVRIECDREEAMLSLVSAVRRLRLAALSREPHEEMEYLWIELTCRARGNRQDIGWDAC